MRNFKIKFSGNYRFTILRIEDSRGRHHAQIVNLLLERMILYYGPLELKDKRVYSKTK